MNESDEKIIDDILDEEIKEAVKNEIEPFLTALQGKYAPDIVANALCVGLIGVASAKAEGNKLIAKTYFTDLVLHWRDQFEKDSDRTDV